MENDTSTLSVPTISDNKMRRRSKSVVSIRQNSDQSDTIEELYHKALSCDRIDKLGTSDKIKAPLKKSFHKTIQGVKKMFSTGDHSLSKSYSVPDIMAQVSSKKKIHHSSTNDSLLDGTISPATNEPIRRRKVSWANKIDTWLEDNTFVSPNRRRKVSWADTFSRSLDHKVDDVVNNELKKPYSSDSNLKEITENQSLEQIVLNNHNHISNVDHKIETTNDDDDIFINTNKVSSITQANDLNKDSFITEDDSSMMENRSQIFAVDKKHVNKLNDISNNTNKSNVNIDGNNNNVNKKISRKFSFDDIDLDIQKHCDVLQRSLTSQPRRNSSKKYRNTSIEDKENDFVSIEDIKKLIENQVHQKLDGKSFDTKLVTSWCKEISNSVRDNLKLITHNKKKVVATTYIGSKCNESQVHVSVKCQKYVNIDDFITVALEGEDMYIWITLLLADY